MYATKEKNQAYFKKYWEDNKEARKKYLKKYWKKNRERIKAEKLGVFVPRPVIQKTEKQIALEKQIFQMDIRKERVSKFIASTSSLRLLYEIQ